MKRNIFLLVILTLVATFSFGFNANAASTKDDYYKKVKKTIVIESKGKTYKTPVKIKKIIINKENKEILKVKKLSSRKILIKCKLNLYGEFKILYKNGKKQKFFIEPTHEKIPGLYGKGNGWYTWSIDENGKEIKGSRIWHTADKRYVVDENDYVILDYAKDKCLFY